jgi:cell division protease FtsH
VNLKNPVSVPVGERTFEVTQFSTRRPQFAENDNLWQLLTDKNVRVSAEPPPGPSLLERLLLGFGPTLLLVGLFVLLPAGPPGARPGWAASAARGPAGTSRRAVSLVGVLRRGQEGAGRR